MNENVFWALKDFENTWFFSSIVDFCSIVDLFLLSFFLFSPNLFNVILWVDKQPHHYAFLVTEFSELSFDCQASKFCLSYLSGPGPLLSSWIKRDSCSSAN